MFYFTSLFFYLMKIKPVTGRKIKIWGPISVYSFSVNLKHGKSCKRPYKILWSPIWKKTVPYILIIETYIHIFSAFSFFFNSVAYIFWCDMENKELAWYIVRTFQVLSNATERKSLHQNLTEDIAVSYRSSPKN